MTFDHDLLEKIEKQKEQIRRVRQFQEETSPYVDIKVKIYSLATTTIIICSDRKMESKYNFTPEQEELLLLVEAAIDAARLRCLGG